MRQSPSETCKYNEGSDGGGGVFLVFVTYSNALIIT